MKQIKIIFFALASFFGIENGQIAADKTTVTVYPENNKIEIIQENLFTVIQSEKSKALVLKQWEKLVNKEENTISWAVELDSFSEKKMSVTPMKKTVQSRLTLTYSTEEDLRVMGIWFDATKNQFSINHVPQQNIKTKDGELTGNYWSFKGDKKFSFTVEPFLQMPEQYQKLKISVKELLIEKNEKVNKQ